MKILFVLDNYAPYIGGAETMFQKLAEGLAARGHNIKVVCPWIIKGTPFREQLNGVEIYRCKSGGRYLYTLFSVILIWYLAAGVDIIHTTTYNAAPGAWLVAKLKRKTVIITIHEILGKLWRKFMGTFKAIFHWCFERMILSLSFDKFVAVSQFTGESLKRLKIRKQKVSVIYHGVDNELFDSKKYNGEEIRQKLDLQKNFIYLFFGRPGISKGLEYLIRAVPLIKKRIIGARLLLILAKEPQGRYKIIRRLIQDLGIDNDIILRNPVHRQELPKYLVAADCIVIPSLSEGFGFSAAESCAMNRPVVASRVGALPEVISGRVVWVKSEDSSSIADGVFKIYQNRWQKLPSKKFYWSRSISEYIKLYQKLCE